jgi:hypothetical protein
MTHREETIEKLQYVIEQATAALKKAKKSDRRATKAKAKLQSFPLALRIFQFRRFSGLRLRIARYSSQRFAYTAMAMSMARLISHYKKILKKGVPDAPSL